MKKLIFAALLLAAPSAAFSQQSGVSASAVTPNDAADLPSGPTKGVYVGGAGDVQMAGRNSASNSTGVLWKAVPAGTVIWFSARRVFATGTTATNIVAIY